MNIVKEFDLHGIVGIRFINPSEKDIEEFKNQFCITETPLDRDPDIIIEYVDYINSTDMKLLSINYAGYNKDNFFIYSKSGNSAKAIFPFEQIGSSFKIECENGFGTIPHLIEIFNLTFIKKRYIPIHGTGIQYNDRGLVACGWENGGKTEALLSLAVHGAYYIADDWVILSEDGSKMIGIPVPVFLWEWKFKYIPNIKKLVSLESKILLKSVHAIKFMYSLFNRGFLKNFFLLKLLTKAMPLIDRQLKVKILPDKLFTDKMKSSSHTDIILLFICWSKPEIECVACEPEEIAQRMLNSNSYEYSNFNEYYNAFKFAFPNRKNEFLEHISEHQNNLMVSAFKGKKTFIVYHPYPVSFDLLYDKIKLIIE